jgi:hypothetical protein
MNLATLLEGLEAVPAGAVFMYRDGSLPKIRRGAGVLCAEAAREIKQLWLDVEYWRHWRNAAVAACEIQQEQMRKLRDELKTLKDELDIARYEIEQLRAKAGE